MTTETDKALYAEVNKILSSLANVHDPSGPIYQIRTRKACLSEYEDELETIHNLVESHAPGLRQKATYRYERGKENDASAITLNKKYVHFKCANFKDGLPELLNQVNDMPKEWTIVQLTSQIDVEEILNVNSEQFYTSSLFISVFNCGQKDMKPFYIVIDPPKSKLTNSSINIIQEMNLIVKENKKKFETHKLEFFHDFASNQKYREHRKSVISRLQNVVRSTREDWLKEWCCLFIGKFCDEELEQKIIAELENKLKELKVVNTDKKKYILRSLMKGASYLTALELRKGVEYCFPGEENKDIVIQLIKFIKSRFNEYKLRGQNRHPVILVIDEKLDIMPWEMLDVLEDHPISRMPSFHFTYALFKEHENTIVDGVKVGVSSKKGKYIINPDLDLKRMEGRLKLFFDYWTPTWGGLVGKTPSAAEFENLLLTSDIFIYCGHGNGTQFLSADQIQRLRVNAVTFLFGCASVALSKLGPQVEMHGSYQMYLIACSPCVIGMLWEVSDTDTDLLCTELLSQCIFSKAATHWKYIDKPKWEAGERIIHSLGKASKNTEKCEKEVLRALCKARKAAKQYINQAACVARGLPVRID